MRRGDPVQRCALRCADHIEIKIKGVIDLGISNCCVFGKYEGLYYIDYDDIHVFRHKDYDPDGYDETKFQRELDYGELTSGDWLFDSLATQFAQQEILDSFTSDFLQMFPNFSQVCPGLWISRSQKAVLESPLFYICLEDNTWSLAVELIQKEPPQGRSYAGLQANCYQRYLKGIERCLLNHLSSIGIYKGPWTSARIKREELIA